MGVKVCHAQGASQYEECVIIIAPYTSCWPNSAIEFQLCPISLTRLSARTIQRYDDCQDLTKVYITEVHGAICLDKVLNFYGCKSLSCPEASQYKSVLSS